ncbi:MAG: HEAT repeat protein, partial [Myxococcota bacterium]
MQIPNSKLIIVVLLLGLGPLSAHLWLQNGRLEQRALEAEARASAPVVAQPAPKRLRRAVVRPRLAPVRSGDTLDSLLGQLKLTTSEATAADVVRRLGAIGPEAIGALSELVEDERARIATAAAESLGRIGGPGPLGLLEDLIYRRDWTRLSVGADGLALSDDALALPLLIRALSEPVTYGRRGPLLRALGATQKPDAVGALTQSLYDGAPNMRREAAGALARSAVGRGVLLDALADSTPLTIRRDALAALSRSLDPRVDVAVEQVLAMPFSALKPQAIQALGRREGSEERLTLFLLQGTQSERMAAANALAERDTAAASEVLAAALP